MGVEDGERFRAGLGEEASGGTDSVASRSWVDRGSERCWPVRLVSAVGLHGAPWLGTRVAENSRKPKCVIGNQPKNRSTNP